VNQGDVWVDDAGDELTIVGAVREWSHLCLTVRDRIGVKFIEPDVLQKKYTLLKPAPFGAAEIELVKQERNGKTPRPAGQDTRMMTERQADYLRSLCETVGEKFDSNLTLAEASEQITRLRQLTS